MLPVLLAGLAATVAATAQPRAVFAPANSAITSAAVATIATVPATGAQLHCHPVRGRSLGAELWTWLQFREIRSAASGF